MEPLRAAVSTGPKITVRLRWFGEGATRAPGTGARVTELRTAPQAPRTLRTRPRLEGVDVARALAVLGMLAVNVGPRDAEGVTAAFFRIPHGRASLLFVLLAGVGISLLTRRARLPGGTLPWPTLLWRATLLLVGGLALQLLDHDVTVILPTYAVLFLLAVPLVRAPDRVLLVAAGAAVVAGPLAWLTLQTATGSTFDLAPAELTDAPGEVVRTILLTGPYPVVTWLAPFLVGMWVGRQDLAARHVQRRLLVGGSVAALAAVTTSRLLVTVLGEPGERLGPDRLVSAVAHSQMPLWLVGGAGAALAVLGAALLLVPRLSTRPLRAVVSALGAAGRLSLTIYVAHLVVLALLVRPGPETAAEGVVVTLLMAAAAVILAAAWTARFGQGPLERLMRLPRTAALRGPR